jgi:polyphosphate kinase
MGRNLDRRVELMFPIEDQVWAEFVKREVLVSAWRDNVGARQLDESGAYSRMAPTNGAGNFDSQGHLVLARVRQHPKKVIPRESPQ